MADGTPQHTPHPGTPVPQAESPCRRRWRIAGQVQGVGFRPFVHRLATRLRLTGFVQNAGSHVIVEAQGAPATLDQFARLLRDEAPRLAVIRQILHDDIPPAPGNSFAIAPSAADRTAATDISIDTAVCPDCLRELHHPADPRFAYALINCTNCGPRFTIVRDVPYDRVNTTMAPWPLCPACAAQYANPADRRYHAQPVCCPVCGPQVSLLDSAGNPLPGDPIATAAARLRDGRILAIKGLGGYHLACRADSADAVALLRQRKKRDAKPFAVMVEDLDAARLLGHVSLHAAEALTGPAAPIVLIQRRPNAPLAEGIATGLGRVGIMLPNTPLQHLLVRALRTGSANAAPPLVMTSGNLADEPLITDDALAITRLGPLVDALLTHQRPIQRGVDDSVVLDRGDAVIPIRRARGYVPTAITLPAAAGMGLCMGGELKNTLAVVKDAQAVLSHHLGDLGHVETLKNLRQCAADMQRLFGIQPAWVAVDRHPAYVSSNEGRRIAAATGAELLEIQHHHAHAAAVMAEHGITERVLAVVCDGTGYGDDRTIWGGELLACDLLAYSRLAHLRPLTLPGGDAAAKDTRRCALALLRNAFGLRFADQPATLALFPDPAERDILIAMIRDQVNTVASSGAGRVFDGIAALLGISDRNHYEAEAAMRLEALAASAPWKAPSQWRWTQTITTADRTVIDFAPAVRELLRRKAAGAETADLAAWFHEEFCRAWCDVVRRAAADTGFTTVVLSGGVMCNSLISRRLAWLLQQNGLAVLEHRLVPPNDGGLALGQAAIAAARLSHTDAPTASAHGGASCA